MDGGGEGGRGRGGDRGGARVPGTAALYRGTVPLLPGKQKVTSEQTQTSPLSLCRETPSQLLYY